MKKYVDFAEIDLNFIIAVFRHHGIPLWHLAFAIPNSTYIAPKARNMIARGKRRAQRGASPLVSNNQLQRALKVRNIIAGYSALSELHGPIYGFPRGDAPRFAQRLPLAIIFRAVGAFDESASSVLLSVYLLIKFT
ncbi:MAG TPA: hypothetical protein VGP83_16010 [Pyrinomonadaceae bacterium]|jgi:hypothetical protein|nr:hypothetical protein [Pyrinomonadaceae bacterium]